MAASAKKKKPKAKKATLKVKIKGSPGQVARGLRGLIKQDGNTFGDV